MAATDALAFPEQTKALLVYGVFTLITTGKESAGSLTTLTASVSKDGGAWASCTNAPVQQGTTGIVSVLLTTTETTASSIRVRFSSALANTVDVVKEFNLLAWTSKAGRGASRFEELIRKSCESTINVYTQSGATLTIYCDDGITASVTGAFTPGDTTATRAALS